MTKILITGAGGYIGSVATDLFLQKGYEVVGVDNYMRGYESPLQFLQKKYGEEKFRYCEADISDKDALFEIFSKESGVETVIHYAALCNVGESEKDPALYFDNNVHGVLMLLEAMRANGVDKLVFSSTCATYGEPQQEKIDESHPQNPTHPYGESKLMAEKIIHWYSRLFGLKYVFLRYFNVCGATEDGELGDSKNPSFHLMQNAVRGALGLAEFKLDYTKVETPDGSPIRDYVNVVDLNEAHVLAVEHLNKTGKSDVFNLGTGDGNSVLEIIDMVKHVTGKTFDITEGERRKGDVSKAVASNGKITEVLGWKPKLGLEDSVKSLVKWYEKKPGGWKD